MSTDSTIPSDASVGRDDLPTDGLPVAGIELPHARPLGMIAIALLGFLAVAPALDGGFLWLDSDHIPLTADQQTCHALSRIWTGSGPRQSYAPLSQSLFWLEANQWHSTSIGYHAVNLLLHIATALCLWRLLHKLALGGAWLAAAAWAVHPLQVQSVAWIANQPMLLASLLGMASLIAAVRTFSLNPNDIPTPAAALRAMIAYHVLFLAAILSQSTLAILPFIVLALIAWRRGKLALLNVPALIPSILIGVSLATYDHHLAHRTIELASSDYDFSFLPRILIASRAIWFCLGKLVFPWPLSFVYSRWPVSATAYWQYAFPAALLVAAVALGLVSRTLGRAPMVIAAMVLIALFPTLGFFDLPRLRFAFVADDYAYLAIAPILATIAHLLMRRRRGPQTSAITAIGAFIGLVAMASISCVNAAPYHSATQLWNDTLAKTDDDCWLAHEGLAVEILRQTNPSQEAARRELELSLRIHPHQVEAHILIGQLLVSRNNFTGAIAEFGAAHAVADQPNDIRPGVQIADALLRQGLKAQAAAALDNLLAMDADDIDLHLQYAVLLDNDGQASQAVDQCRAAVALDNGNDRAWADLASCLWHLGNFPDAADAMLHAINLGPPDAQRLDTYGMILLADENIDPAIAQFNAALKLDPGLVMAHRNLAAAYMKQGRVADAQKELRRAQNSTGG